MALFEAPQTPKSLHFPSPFKLRRHFTNNFPLQQIPSSEANVSPLLLFPAFSNDKLKQIGGPALLFTAHHLTFHFFSQTVSISLAFNYTPMKFKVTYQTSVWRLNMFYKSGL